MAVNIYDPYKDIKEILNAGKNWQKANADGNTAAQDKIAQNAQQFYNNLKNNGYGNLASELSSSDTAARQKIANQYAQKGKTAIRPYFYSMGKQYGLSNGDIDNMLSYNNATGEASFAGTNMGTPHSNVDGTTYWDEDKLHKYFTDALNRIGQYKTPETKINEADKRAGDMLEKLSGSIYDDKNMMTDKYGRLENYNYDTNPYETEIGKSIMDGYRWNGKNAGNNQIASGAGNNGGNIDSFSAANAARQQLAFETAGKQAVLNDFNSRVANAQNILAGLGGYLSNTYSAEQGNIGLAQNEAQRLFDNNETALNNDVARESQKAQVTGYVPAGWSIQNDAFLRNFVDEKGKLRAEYNNVDFQELINNAKANGDAELANKYAILRGMKIFGNFENYGKFLNNGDVSYTKPQRTADYDLTKQQIDSAERISNAGNNTSLEATKAQLASNENIASIEADNAKEVANIQAKNALDQITTSAKSGVTKAKPSLSANQAAQAIKDGNITQGVIDAYNYYYDTDYTVDNPPKTTDKNQTKTMSSLKKDWMKYLNDYVTSNFGEQILYKPEYDEDNPAFTNTSPGKYTVKPQFREPLVAAVLKDKSLTMVEKVNLLKDFGVSEDQIYTVISDKHYKDE